MRKIKCWWIDMLLLFFSLGMFSGLSCKKNTDVPAAVIKDSLSVTGISPDNGVAGTIVTITGSHFDADPVGNVVKFNGVPATVLTNDTGSFDRTKTLHVQVPKRAGTGPVTVGDAKFIAPGPVFNYIPIITVTTLAGGGSPGSPGSSGYADGLGRYALFNAPTGIAVDPAGNVYVADEGNNRIRKIAPDSVVSTLAGSGVAGYAEGQGTAAAFNKPQGVAVDVLGNIYVADLSNYRVRKISPGGMVSTLAGTGVPGDTDGPGATATFNSLIALATDTGGNVYAVDALNFSIRSITPDGVVSTFLSSQSGTVHWLPTGIATDSRSNIYFTDVHGNLVLESTQGVNCTLAGTGNSGLIDGAGVIAEFNSPEGVCADTSGNIYVVDAGNYCIRKISIGQGVATNPSISFGFFRNTQVITLAGTGVEGYADGDPKTAKFNRLSGIGMDGQGNLYVADTGNNCIRKIVIE